MSISHKQFPFQNKKRQLLVHKLSETSPQHTHYYQKAIDSLFDNPDNFFETFYNGKQVVVGRKNPSKDNLIQLTVGTPKLPRRSLMQAFKRGTLFRKSSHSILNRSSLSSKGLHNSINNINELPPNQQYVDDQDLKKIFDGYRNIQKHNLTASNSNSHLIRTMDPKLKNELSQILDLQEKTLKTFHNESKGREKLINYLSNKLKKSSSELLMNKISHYRVKREIMNECDEEIKNQRPLPPNQWGLTLRQSSDQVNHYYINVGSERIPKWQLFIQKPKPMKETIRNPEAEDNNEIKEIKNYLNNKYLKSKVPAKSFTKFKETANFNSFNTLEVKGKDLLQFEQDNSKMLKGKKILFLPSFGREMRQSLLLGKDVNLPVLIKCKK